MLKVYVGFHDALLRSVDASNPRAIVLTLGYPDEPAEVVVFESADDLRYWGEGPPGYHVIGRICLIEHLKVEPPHIGVRPEQWREILEVVRSEQLGDWCIIIDPIAGPTIAILGKSVPVLKSSSLGKELVDIDDF